MAYPVRFKLVRKDTGETFNQWVDRAHPRLSGKLMPFLTHDGNPGYVSMADFYLTYHFLKPAEWKLLLASEKDDRGRWAYQQMGY